MVYSVDALKYGAETGGKTGNITDILNYIISFNHMRDFKIKERDVKEHTALEKYLNIDRFHTKVNKKRKKHQRCVCVRACLVVEMK